MDGYPERDESQEALGQSEAFIEFQERLSQVAPVDRPVLIVGERGTGKELAAKRIHYLSKRWEEPFIALNCAALSPTLIESELFGHEHGAFTGAHGRRTGRFEAADGGTLFLDELGNIPKPVQEKILRVVEYGAFERVGGSDVVHVDVRIVAATNADLRALAARGHFMRDLLDRLSFEVLYVPPLREREEDIILLAQHYAARMAYELGRAEAPDLGDAAIDALLEHSWRGNVRELKNVVERAVYRTTDDEITKLEFDPFAATDNMHDARLASEEPQPETRPEPPLDDEPVEDFTAAVEAYELRLLRAALDATRFNQRQAAERVGLTYHQFRGLYRKYKDRLEEDGD